MKTQELHHSQFCPEEMALLAMIETIKEEGNLKKAEILLRKSNRTSELFLFRLSQQGHDFWDRYYFEDHKNDFKDFI